MMHIERTNRATAMDLRTKLIFACVLVSLVSMMLLGFFMHRASATSVADLNARQLDALASARLEDIEIIRQAWREQALLITSRTSLRDLVAAHTPESPMVGARVEQILRDARESVTIFRRLTVFDRHGNLVSSSGDARQPAAVYANLIEAELAISGFTVTGGGGIDAIAHVPLDLDNERIGQLEAVIDTRRLLDITRNFAGLGETGETYLVGELEPGEFTALNALRGVEDGELIRLPRHAATDVMLAAMAGANEVLRGAIDYRGERVWAATRKLPNSTAALIVKMDEREVLQPQLDLQARFTRVALSVVALAILGGALLGAWLAAPIRRLRGTIEDIRSGNHDLRADTSGEDEVSFLAESFNALMDEQQGGRGS